MTDTLAVAAEERFGIKSDTDDIKKLHEYMEKKYGSLSQTAIEKVFSSGEAAEFLTVNETYFFREPAHFVFLKNQLPSYQETGLRICCAAVSSGCEAFSIAMLVEAHNINAEKTIRYHIDAFDLNPKVIGTACRGGPYSGRCLREDGNSFHFLADKYLKKTADGYMVSDSLKKNVSFFVHNLMEKLPRKNYDFVFFRNAFVYFLPRARDRLLSNLCGALSPRGILIMGVAETAGVQHQQLASGSKNDVFYFQKCG